MADNEKKFQVRIETTADPAGIEQTEAGLARLKEEAGATTPTPGQGFPTGGAGGTGGPPAEEGAKAAAGLAADEARVAVESQLQVIAATKNELLAAQIAGNTALVAQTRLELAVRQATLGVMRTKNITQAELVALTANEEVLLNGIAAAHGRTALSIGINRTGAAALAQSLATGNFSAASLGRSLSGLATPITLAAIAGYTLYGWIAHAADESLEFAQNIDKQTDALVKQVGEWNHIAKLAGSPADVASLGKSILPALEEASAKLKEIRDRELGFWEEIGDKIAGSINAGPLMGSGASPFAEKQKEYAAEQKKVNDARLLDANIAVDRAQAAAETWDRIKSEPLDQAIKEYRIEVENATKAERDLNAERGKSPEKFNEWAKASNDLQTYLARYKSLTDEESKRSKLHDQTLESINAELAIDRARAGGNEELAKKLERQRDLQKEINDLKAKGLSETEATTLAQEKQNLETQIQSQKDQPKQKPLDQTPAFDIAGRDVTDVPFSGPGRLSRPHISDLDKPPDTQLPDRGGDLAGASEKLKGGGDELKGAGTELSKAGTDLTARARELTEGIRKVTAAAAALAGIRPELNNLEARLRAVESR